MFGYCLSIIRTQICSEIRYGLTKKPYTVAIDVMSVSKFKGVGISFHDLNDR